MQITVDGITYEPTSPKEPATKEPATKELPFVIIRSRDSGVHAGYLQSVDPEGQVVLLDSRRIWYWDGAASLSEIAVYGCNPDRVQNCKFGALLPLLKLRYSDCCEEIACLPAGKKMIEDQPEWLSSDRSEG